MDDVHSSYKVHYTIGKTVIKGAYSWIQNAVKSRLLHLVNLYLYMYFVDLHKLAFCVVFLKSRYMWRYIQMWYFQIVITSWTHCSVNKTISLVKTTAVTIVNVEQIHALVDKSITDLRFKSIRQLPVSKMSYCKIW